MSGKMLQFVNQAKAMPKKRTAQERVDDFNEIYADFELERAKNKPLVAHNVACLFVK